MHHFWSNTPAAVTPNNDFFLSVQLAEREFQMEKDFFRQEQGSTIASQDESVINEEFFDYFKRLCENKAEDGNNNNIITPIFCKLTSTEQSTLLEKRQNAAFMLSILRSCCQYLEKHNLDKTFKQKQLPWIKEKQQAVLGYINRQAKKTDVSIPFPAKLLGILSFFAFCLSVYRSPHFYLVDQYNYWRQEVDYTKNLPPEKRQTVEQGWLAFNKKTDPEGLLHYQETKLHEHELKLQAETLEIQTHRIVYGMLLLVCAGILIADRWNQRKMNTASHPHLQNIKAGLDKDISSLETQINPYQTPHP